MLNRQTEATRNHHVSITYGDGFHSFQLAFGTTLGELAQRVRGLAPLHDGVPLTIEVVLERPQVRSASPAGDGITTH